MILASFPLQDPTMFTRPRPLSRLAALLPLVMAGLPGVTLAALPVGAPAPDFSADAALGGQPYRFVLADALKKGPVVLYFYPKAFTSGCTVEAHQFAEATPKFAALGATVVGMSNDDIDTLKKFSVEACRNQFAVAADPDAKVIKAYDAGFALKPDMANRISYVIAPGGKVLLAYSAMDPSGHVDAAMKAVQAWKSAQPR
jgi:thioredoxin-dependent peroxiredoxin